MLVMHSTVAHLDHGTPGGKHRPASGTPVGLLSFCAAASAYARVTHTPIQTRAKCAPLLTSNQC